MKKLLLLLFSLISFSALAQPKGTPTVSADVASHTYIGYIFDPLQSNPSLCKIMYRYWDSTRYELNYKKITFDSLIYNTGTGTNFIGINPTTGSLYMSSLTSAQVVGALGFTPISSYSETDPLFNTKFATKTTTDLPEGTNTYFTNARARTAVSLTTTGSGAATYNNTTGVFNIPTPASAVTPTYNNSVSRPVNSTSFTPSSTQPYRVYYNVEISCTATIGGASSGSVVLQYYNGSTWVNTAGTIKNSNTVSLAIVLNSATIQGGTISGEFPANTQLRLVSTSTGTTTITYNTGQEILY